MKSDNFRIKYSSYNEISAFLSYFIFYFYTSLFILGRPVNKKWENFVFLVLFDTCDVVYDWFVSLLPPIVLDNLFGSLEVQHPFIILCLENYFHKNLFFRDSCQLPPTFLLTNMPLSPFLCMYLCPPLNILSCPSICNMHAFNPHHERIPAFLPVCLLLCLPDSLSAYNYSTCLLACLPY